MKKILICSAYEGLGGAEKFAIKLFHFLQKNGENVFFLHLNSCEEKIEGIEPKRLIVCRDSSSIKKLFFYHKILKILKPDVVLCCSWQISFLMFFASLNFKKIKFVTRETSIPSLKYKMLASSKFFFYLYKKVFLSAFQTVISQSQDMTKDLLAFSNIDKKKIITINNPAPQWKYTSLGKIAEYDFLFVGRLIESKNIKFILYAFLLALKEKSSLKLAILGAGPLENSLRENVKSAGAEKSVYFLGFIPDPGPIYEKGKALVLASKREGFPNVALEALSCGLPLLSLDSPGGINELIKDGFNGVIVKESNVAQMKEQMIIFSNYSFDKEKIISDCHQRFSYERIMKEYQGALTGP